MVEVERNNLNQVSSAGDRSNRRKLIMPISSKIKSRKRISIASHITLLDMVEAGQSRPRPVLDCFTKFLPLQHPDARLLGPNSRNGATEAELDGGGANSGHSVCPRGVRPEVSQRKHRARNR